MAASLLLLSLLHLTSATETYFGHSQACEAPDQSSIDWRPKANDTRIFNVGREQNYTREIRVSVPPTYNSSASAPPLIIAFHDKEMNTADFEYASRLSDRSTNKDSVVVYPLAKNDTWRSDIVVRRWQKDPSKTKKTGADDLAWMKELMSDLDTVICFDKAKVHAVGMGTGAGMVHLIACNHELSAQFASYSMVAGGFGTKKTDKVWEECNPAYRPIPVLEIHGEEDSILPYYLAEWEPAKSRMSIPRWLEDWEERNLCGSATEDPVDGVDANGADVKITKLENDGWKSVAEDYGGQAWRLALSCPGEIQSKSKTPPALPTDDGDKLGAENKKEEVILASPNGFSLLHYRVKGLGHVWPTLQLKTDEKGGTKLFDATTIVLDWMRIHKLPEPEGEIIKSEDINPQDDAKKSDNEHDEL